MRSHFGTSEIKRPSRSQLYHQEELGVDRGQLAGHRTAFDVPNIRGVLHLQSPFVLLDGVLGAVTDRLGILQQQFTEIQQSRRHGAVATRFPVRSDFAYVIHVPLVYFLDGTLSVPEINFE